MIIDLRHITGIPGKKRKINKMKKILVLKKTDTIKKGFELIKGQIGMIICVLEGENILSGVVSEGDLRRAIINGNSQDTELKSVMNKNPTFIYENELKSKKIIESNIDLGATMDRPLIIPVVDQNKKLLYVINTENLFETIQTNQTKKFISEVKKATHFSGWRRGLHRFYLNCNAFKKIGGLKL